MSTAFKIILGIETSCDETSAAVLLKNGESIQILSNIVTSSASLQAKYGGVIPEQAAREQLKFIIPVISEALLQAKVTKNQIDAIAATFGPGLIGSLLVGVETTKTLSLIWDRPLIPINHLIGHFYANWITEEGIAKNLPTFPCIGLLVSGGHTDLVLFKNHGRYQYLGGTRDDAAGECFDKCAKLLNLPYPGGPIISKLAQKGDAKIFNLPRPMIDTDDFDFSFSGLKTAVFRMISEKRYKSYPQDLAKVNLAASIEQAIVDVLVKKTISAAQKYNIDQVIVSGGVAANTKLKKQLQHNCQLSIVNCQLFIPPPHLCTDNAAMVAAAAFYYPNPVNPLKLQVNPNLSLIK